MFPSKNPLLYILHVLVVAVVIICAIVGGLVTGQPLSLLAILGLHWLPEWPLVQNLQPEQEPGDYDGTGTVGFAPPSAG